MTKLGSDSLVTVFGGSGFVGRHIVREIAQTGARIRVGVRKPNQALFLKLMGDVGQIQPIQVNLRDEASCQAAINGADVVINLVGLLYEKGQQTFKNIHVDGVSRVSRLAAETGVQSFVHLSALGASSASESTYARSKARGESIVLENFPGAIILRPSIIFGPEDGFFNRFATMALFTPVLPLIGGGKTRFQPVYVKDVARALLAALQGRPGIYELGGPEIMNFRSILEMVLAMTGRRRMLLPLPFALARGMGQLAQFLPVPPLTPDQVILLKHDNVISTAAQEENRTLKGLGIAPTAAASILPTYLARFRKAGQFYKPAG